MSKGGNKMRIVFSFRSIQMKIILICAAICMIALRGDVSAVESGMFRLLSISGSEKIILVSQISDKKKFLLDASDAKITVDGNPVEFDVLSQFSIVQVKMELSKKKKNSINLDGRASEIKVLSPETYGPDASR